MIGLGIAEVPFLIIRKIDVSKLTQLLGSLYVTVGKHSGGRIFHCKS